MVALNLLVILHVFTNQDFCVSIQISGFFSLSSMKNVIMTLIVIIMSWLITSYSIMLTFHNLSLYFIEKIEVIHRIYMYHRQSKPHNFLPSEDMAFPYCLKQSLSEAQSTSIGITTQRTIPLSPYLP